MNAFTPVGGSALAVGLGAALGSTTSMGPAGVALLYGTMVASQTSGPVIIGLLHNASAGEQAARMAEPDDVQADLAMDQLCAGYESHHYQSTSNSLHAAGMVLTFALIVGGVRSPLQLLPFVPPTWYLFAWVGHFFYQADVPAVFTYGMSLRGWAVGEWCSIKALAAGRTTSSVEDKLLAAAIMVAWGLGRSTTRALRERASTRKDGKAD